MASWYKHLKANTPDLDSFETVLLEKKNAIDNFHSPDLYMDDCLTQRAYLKSRGGILTPNFIGRFERLEEDFASLCDKLGTKAELPHLNKQSYDYREMYTDKLAEKLAERCKWDIETFGYTFGG